MKKKSKLNSKLLILFGLITFILLSIVSYFGFSYYVASEMTKSNHEIDNKAPQLIADNYQDITIQKPEGGYLKGWLFKGSSQKLVIFVAGFSQKRIDSENNIVLISRDLIALGYNVLVYDNQAMGQSTGDRVTFGIKESKDLVTVVNYAKGKGFEAKNMGVIGYSMGAIAELLASDSLSDVGALVADSPAEDVKGTIVSILENEKHVPSIFMPVVFFMLRTVYAIDIDSIRPADHVALVPERAFLYLHGGRDITIFPWNSQKLLAISNPKGKLIIFPNGKHVETYKTDPNLYRKEVFGFLKEQLGK